MEIDRAAYRPWSGKQRFSFLGFWPIARTGMVLVLRRRIFWLFLLIGLANFLFHFAIIYFLTRIQVELARQGQQVPPIVKRFIFTESGEGYRNFIFAQGTVLVLMLAFAGSVLVGDDFRHQAIAFYLSKPISRIHYFIGKLLAASGLAALITLVPAVALFIEYGAFTESADYWLDHQRVLFAILGTGLLVSLGPAAILLGVASLCRRTIPIILAWGAIFLFLPMAGNLLREVFRTATDGDPWGWSLLDLWSDLRWIANVFFGLRLERYADRWPWALVVTTAWVALSLCIFWRRLRSAEVVR